MPIKRKQSRTSDSYSFHDNKLLRLELPSWRAKFVHFLFFMGFCALLGKAFYLQVVQVDFLQGKGEARYLRDIEIAATRGKIMDRNGDILAVSRPVYTVRARTKKTKSMDLPQQVRLAQLLDMDPRDLRKKLRKKRKLVQLKRGLDKNQSQQVLSMKLSGIEQEQEFQRFYPVGREIAHVVGFTGRDDKGQEGLELAFDTKLQGVDGSRKVIKDRRGRIVEDIEEQQVVKQGANVHLAIDVRIQHQAYLQLKKAITENKAKAGSAVVLDSQTGEVLALVNLPDFDPNQRDTMTSHVLRNRAVTDQFEPGSTLKPLAVALALERIPGLTPETVFHIGNGQYNINGTIISDAAKKRSDLTVQQIIQYSSNVGVAKITKDLPGKAIWTMFDRIGFGHPLETGYPGEVGGKLHSWKKWGAVDKATISYGHGIAVTLLQLANSYVPLARGGDMIPLSILRKENAADKDQAVQIFELDTVRQIRTMLEMAVSDHGTAPKARVPGYRVGGKTGTAYKVENGLYVKKYISSFVGIAPMSQPRLVVAVMLDEPTGAKYYGGDVAGPAFSSITRRALRVLNIPMDGEKEGGSVAL